jgi:hypothetical protein
MDDEVGHGRVTNGPHLAPELLPMARTRTVYLPPTLHSGVSTPKKLDHGQYCTRAASPVEGL